MKKSQRDFFLPAIKPYIPGQIDDENEISKNTKEEDFDLN